MSESATNPEVDFKKVHLGSTIDLQIGGYFLLRVFIFHLIMC